MVGQRNLAFQPGISAGMMEAKWMPVESNPMNRRFRYLVAATTAFVFATVLLGVATKSYGAGLACKARWPICDGGLLNLFPASFPSFFEWIHRVVAGVGGLFIVGTALESWRRDTPPAIRNDPPRDQTAIHPSTSSCPPSSG